MRNHLNPYFVPQKEALRQIFGGATREQIKNTEISVRCGNAPRQSYFVFIKGAGNASQITGYCLSNRLDHLLEDFDYLISQMLLSKETFKLYDIYIGTNDEKLVKKSAWKYISKRAVLADFIAMTSLIPLISAWLLFWEIKWSAICPIVVGFIFWLVILYIGYRSEPEYVLKK